MMRRAFFVLLVITAAAPWARADPADVAAAESLFREARALMKAGNYEAACPKLEDSQRLDPGVGTLANLALCYEKTNRLASAWAKYREAADEATRRGEKKRAKQAAKMAETLEPKLHRVAIIVPRSSQVEGLKVTRNGAVVGEGSFGSEVPVDAGEITVTAEAPGRKPWSVTIATKKGRRVRVIEVPALEKKPIKIAKGGDGGGGRVIDEFETVPAGPWYGDVLGWALVGGGVAMLAGGGLGALPHASSLEKSSREPGIGPEEFDRRKDQARTFKTLGIALLASGGALAIVGGVKLSINPDVRRRRSEPRTSVVVGPGFASLRVSF